MRRRDFIKLIGGSVAAASPFVAWAQQPGVLPTIGYLGPNVASVDHPRIAAFAQRLSELGWVEGHSVIIERRAGHQPCHSFEQRPANHHTWGWYGGEREISDRCGAGHGSNDEARSGTRTFGLAQRANSLHKEALSAFPT
jgi:hypothetical protein